MKILKKLIIGLVCLTLISSIGCTSKKKASASPSTAKTSTATNKASATVKASAAATATAASTPASTAASTEKPVNNGPLDGGFVSDTPLLYNLFVADQEDIIAATKTPLQVTDNDMAIAGQFYATTSMNYIEAFCPSWSNAIGNLTLSIYNWKTDYETTIAGTPLKSQEFVDFADNVWLQLKFDTPLPAGQYLWVLNNPVEQVGIWDVAAGPEGHESDVVSYYGGSVVDTFHVFRIEYTKTPKITLAKLS